MNYAQFTDDRGHWGSHRNLLWHALEATIGPVIELGCGDSSTPFLYEYCQDQAREFTSYDSNKEWAAKYDQMGTFYVPDWDKSRIWQRPYGVCLLDLAPGEYRATALMKISSTVIVIHDSEPVGWNASDYRVRPLFKKFRYAIDDIPEQKGAPWTTALSNVIDVSKWII